MVQLVVERISSANRIRASLTRGEARDYGDLDGETLTMDDDADAQTLVDTYPNVRWGDAEADHSTDTAETCETVKADGEVCGRDLPCRFHSDDGE